MNITQMETKVYAAVMLDTDPDCGWGPTLETLKELTGLPTKVLRGVIASLVKKGFVQVDDAEGDKPTLYNDTAWVNPDH